MLTRLAGCSEGEVFPITRYADVAAVVYYLKAVPWTVPDLFGGSLL